MKTLFNRLFVSGLALAMVTLVSCRDEDKYRIPELQEAPNVRIQIKPEFSYFDFEAKPQAKLVFGVYSQNFASIESVQIIYRYQPSGAPTCANRGCLGPFVAKTYSAADLAAKGGIIENEEITLTSLLADINRSIDDIQGGDQFFFENITTMKDGRVYPSPTVGTATNIPAGFVQTSSFTPRFSAIVGCPVNAPFTGNYRMEQIVGPSDPFFGNPTRWTTKNVTITSVNPITRRFANGTYLTFTDRVMQFILLCGDVIVPQASLGVGCSGNNLTVRTWSTPAVYNPANDAQFDVHVFENVTAACGIPANEEMLIRFTKQ